MAKVTLRNVHKVYRSDKGEDATVVRDFNFESTDREFVVLLGPAGTGKSTILRMIAGLENVTGGDVLIDDRRVNDLPPKDRDVAMVFGDGALYPHMSVRDNLAFGLKLRKFSSTETKKRVQEAAAILGIEPCLDRKPPALSGEERQRTALARAMVSQPKVLLFDEPLLKLDEATRERMRADLARLHQRLQATILCATSGPVVAMTLGERVVAMREGAVQQVGTPLELYRQPANLFVAGLLGSPPMNFIQGRLRESGEALFFKEKGEGVIECALANRPSAKSFAGRDVLLGVRPEDIALVAGDRRLPGQFQALVDAVDWTGAETNIHIQTGAHSLVSRSAAAVDRGEMGHRARFEIAAQQAHLFDPETTNRIA